MNTIKDTLITVDLSDIKVEGYTLGDKVQELDFRGKYPNNLFFNMQKFKCDETTKGEVSYLGDFYISNCKIVKIQVDLTVYNVEVNNKKVTTVDEILKILGNNYSTNIEKLSYYYDTYTFIDHKNNLELHIADMYKDKSKPYIELKSIDRKYTNKYITFNLKPDNSFGFA